MNKYNIVQINDEQQEKLMKEATLSHASSISFSEFKSVYNACIQYDVDNHETPFLLWFNSDFELQRHTIRHELTHIIRIAKNKDNWVTLKTPVFASIGVLIEEFWAAVYGFKRTLNFKDILYNDNLYSMFERLIRYPIKEAILKYKHLKKRQKMNNSEYIKQKNSIDRCTFVWVPILLFVITIIGIVVQIP